MTVLKIIKGNLLDYLASGALYLALNVMYPWWYILVGLSLTWLWITSIITLMDDDDYVEWTLTHTKED